jgi:hypothetical protein
MQNTKFAPLLGAASHNRNGCNAHPAAKLPRKLAKSV